MLGKTDSFATCFLKCFALMTSTHVLLEQPDMVQNYIYLSTLMTMIYWFMTHEDQDTCPLGNNDNTDDSSDSSTEVSEEEDEKWETQQDQTESKEAEEEVVRDYNWLTQVD
jgi:hypothetical protein